VQRPRGLTVHWRVLAVAWAVLLAAPTLTLGFVHDDRALLEGNARLADLSTLPTALFSDLFWLADGVVRPSPYWRPAVTLSYYVDQLVGGGAAWAFHLGNAVAFILLAVVALRAFRGPAAGLAVCCALVHPLFIEPLANITARTDLFVALFGTLALLAPKRWRLLPLALALGCKEVAVLIPGLFWLQARGEGKGTRDCAVDAAPGMAVVLAFVGARQLLVGGRSAGPPWEGWADLPARYVHALARFVWPGAGPRPDLDLSHLPDVPMVVGLLFAVVVFTVPIVLARRTQVAVPLAIVLWPPLVTAGLVAPGLRYADGFAAWPLVGAGWLLSYVPGRAGWGLVLVMMLAYQGHPDKLASWASPDTLWSAALEANPNDPRVQLKAGRVRLANHPEEALTLSRGAQSHTDPRIRREGHELAARALLLMKRSSQEDLDLREHLRIAADPHDLEAGWACAARCVWDDQAPDRWQMCETAVARDASTGDVFNNMGVMRAQAKDYPSAREWFAQAVALEPDRSEFQDNLAKVDRLLKQ